MPPESKFQIKEESITTLSEHGEISIAFAYNSLLELTIVDRGLGGFVLTERKLDESVLKDYDVLNGEGPSSWSDRFDVSEWGLLVARSQGHRIGGAVIAYGSEDVELLHGRDDLAVLWDIRIDPAFRGAGIGAALFKAASRWSTERRCTQLSVETQNTNVAACRFYIGQGCTLGSINRLAYPSLPNEIQMLWNKDLV